MSRTYLWKTGLALSLALLLAGGLAPSAVAGGKGKGKNKVNAATVATIVGELNQTKGLLAMARHDYQGHRVAAVHHIMHAMHLLEHHKLYPNPASQTANLSGGTKGTKEQQAVSDSQLAQAITQLQTISNQIQQLPGNHNHHQHALKEVHKAINQLKTALNVA